MKDFRNLQVWEKAHLLTLAIYKVTRGFPGDEKFGLISQMRRSASSIAANIAEGCGRNGDAELARYLQIAMGSASELEYHILLAHDLNIIETTLNEKLTGEVIEVKKMIASFIKKLRAN